MPKRIFVRSEPDLVKAHVKAFTRKDGSYVKEHDDKRQKKAAAPAGGGGYSHPNVVGKATITDPHSTGPGDACCMQFAGTEYFSTSKKGKSFHDETPVREFESEDGHRVWMDDHGRVHADSVTEVDKLRKKGEAAAGKPAGAPAPGKKESASGGKPASGGDAIASKEMVINNTLGQHNAAAGFISVPPGKAQHKVEEFVEGVKSCGFSLDDGTTYDVNGDSVQLDKNEQGKAVLSDPAGNRVIVMAQDGGDRVRISVSYQAAGQTGDKAAGKPKATSGAPKPAAASGGAEKAPRGRNEQRKQDADDASYAGEAEKEDYGIYHKPGSKVEDRKGEKHEVLRHRGPTVTTKGGKEFHPTKLSPIAEDDGEGLGGGPAKGHRARAKKAEAEEKGFASLKSHPMHSESDLAYFKAKGYSAADVKEIWDRDHAAGHKPVEHKNQPDVVGDHAKFLEKKDKRSQGNLFKSDATGDTIDGRGPEHEDQQDDPDPGVDPKKKRKGETLAKSLERGVRFILGRRHG